MSYGRIACLKLGIANYFHFNKISWFARNVLNHYIIAKIKDSLLWQ